MESRPSRDNFWYTSTCVGRHSGCWFTGIDFMSNSHLSAPVGKAMAWHRYEAALLPSPRPLDHVRRVVVQSTGRHGVSIDTPGLYCHFGASVISICFPPFPGFLALEVGSSCAWPGSMHNAVTKARCRLCSQPPPESSCVSARQDACFDALT